MTEELFEMTEEVFENTSVHQMIEDDKWQSMSLKTLEKLLMQLSVRSNNHLVGSGLGGNASEWWFLVNHKITIKLSTTEFGAFSISKTNPNEIIFWVPVKPDLKQIRGALASFFVNHPNKLDTTEEQLINLSFLRDQPIRDINAKIYLHAVKVGLELIHWLDIKMELDNEMSKVSSKEKNVFRASFLKEMDLPATYFEDCEENDPFEVMYYKHPIWGVRDAAVRKRYGLMFDQLLSQDDLDKMTFIGSCPSFITMPIFRRIICIERVVRLSLDKKCDFLARINKDIDD
jgi:hypothetical protein